MPDVRLARQAEPLRYVLQYLSYSPMDPSIALPQYAFEDFAIRQVAQLLNKTDDIAKYTNRSFVRPRSFCNISDSTNSLDRITETFGTQASQVMGSKDSLKKDPLTELSHSQTRPTALRTTRTGTPVNVHCKAIMSLGSSNLRLGSTVGMLLMIQRILFSLWVVM